MVQAHKRIDLLTATLIVGVAILHLVALNPFAWTREEAEPEDEIEVRIEVAANRPMASMSAPAMTAIKAVTAPPPRPSRPDRAEEVSPQPTISSVAQAATQGAIQGVDVPSTNVSFEVGSTKNPRPPYPPAAFAARIEGRVIVKVHVMPDGKPAEIQLLQTSGSAQLDKSALDTLAKWELQPARKHGEPIDQWIEIPIHFRLLQK
jgi:protein TonB